MLSKKSKHAEQLFQKYKGNFVFNPSLKTLLAYSKEDKQHARRLFGWLENSG